MAASTKLAVVLVILSLFCIGAHASKGCPFRALYQLHWNSISINHRQQLSIHVNNNNTRIIIGETPHDIDFFARHDQWLKNQDITMHKEKSTDNNDYNSFYIVGFIIVVILGIINLLRVDQAAHARKECPFKSMYRKYGNSMMSSSANLGVIGETTHDRSALII
ncbi:hypothetical protein P3S67_004607 [Capsicum chacoense]